MESTKSFDRLSVPPDLVPSDSLALTASMETALHSLWVQQCPTVRAHSVEEDVRIDSIEEKLGQGPPDALPGFFVDGVTTGRISSSKPNLQFMRPIRGKPVELTLIDDAVRFHHEHHIAKEPRLVTNLVDFSDLEKLLCRRLEMESEHGRTDTRRAR